MKNLESESLSYIIIVEFLSDLKEEFSSEDNETMIVAKLQKVEQGNKIIKKFVQEFRRVVRRSGYERRSLVKEFKREMNSVIRRKLIEVEHLPRSIKQ